jgi:type IV secretory pathway VirJ component
MIAARRPTLAALTAAACIAATPAAPATSTVAAAPLSAAAPATPIVPAAPAAAATPGTPARLAHGRFKDVRVFRPAGAPTSVAIYVSGDDGWTSADDAMARRLVEHGSMVTGIDLARFEAVLQADGDECEFADGDLENLSHFIQAYFHSPTYAVPVLVGRAAGASFVYAMLAQAPQDTFAAAIGLGFCPSLNLVKPLCKGSALESTRNARRGVDFAPPKSLGNPFLALQGESDRACPADVVRGFVSSVRGAAIARIPGSAGDSVPSSRRLAALAAAYDEFASQHLTTRMAAAPPGLDGLPVIEVPPAPGAPTDELAIILSGDGGWAGLDRDVATALTAKGIPVVGLDSLRYFWTKRTPEGLASDIDRMIRYYLAHLGKRRALLIGYSQGADVLPFAVNRLPAATRARVALVAVMGLSEHALFEFHLSSWISDDNSGPATLPEVERVSGIPVLCIYGADESDSLCPKLDPKRFDVVKLKGGHHFDGDYANLALQILSTAAPAPAAAH